MVRRANNSSAGHGRGLWPVLAALLLAVLAPTACVLWFASAAMSNERLAVRQRLSDAYRDRLQRHQPMIDGHLAALAYVPKPRMDVAIRLFDMVMRKGDAESVIVFDAQGKPAYPQPPDAGASGPAPASQDWAEGRRLEFEMGDSAAAAAMYAKVAEQEHRDPQLCAQAKLALGRCLLRTGRTDEAIRILLVELSSDVHLAIAIDPFGRNIFLNAQMLVLTSLPRHDARFAPLARLLASQVNSYGGPIIHVSEPIPGVGLRMGASVYGGASMPATQRLFFMETLSHMRVEGVDFSAIEAERLAQAYFASSSQPAEPGRLTATALDGVWQMASSDSRIVCLFRQDRLLASLRSAAGLDREPSASIVRLEAPGARTPGQEPFMTLPASQHMPGWELAIYLTGEDPFAVAAERRSALYLWTAIVGIAVIAAAGALVARYVQRQMTLTRLKNDLIATVSHELKTPLASMRVLVDTMLEGRTSAPQQAEQYLRLIARENERLSRLIDSFLTFSRMERNKRAFDFAPMDVADAVQPAVAAMGERFSAPQSRLEVDVPAGLPRVLADRDALVTVILNLLDNAWKYSGEAKVVTLRAFSSEDAADGGVTIEVADNGVGISRRSMRRIFDRFYQVDQSLSRKAGGCGLGLSIVKFILDAHGGTISVKSQPGRGSTFTVRLPAADERAARVSR